MVGVAATLLGGWLEYSAVQPHLTESADLGPRRTGSAAYAPQPKVTPPAATRPTGVVRKGEGKPGRPVGISVPSLGISARVVSIRGRGTLVPPADPRVVGWWSGGALPGAAKGSVVITGHTVHRGGGAFDDLDRLRVGDTVVVSTVTGRVDYLVASVTIYRKRALAQHAAAVFDQRTAGRLVLVTCEDWNGSTYLSNAVVIGRKHR